jgi:nucleoside-diphosphate-sugar epimerase
MGGPLTLFNNQSCIRDYGFIDDVLSAFLMAGTSREAEYGQKFVIGSGEGWCIADAINLIADRTALQTGHRPTVQQKSDEPLEAVEWRNFIADTSCFSRATGWSHNTSLIEGIDHTVDFFLNELPGSSV